MSTLRMVVADLDSLAPIAGGGHQGATPKDLPTMQAVADDGVSRAFLYEQEGTAKTTISRLRKLAKTNGVAVVFANVGPLPIPDEDTGETVTRYAIRCQRA